MDELDKALKLYEQTFGEAFPMFPMRTTTTTNEVVDIINKCIDNNKDVYDMGYLSLNADVIY